METKRFILKENDKGKVNKNEQISKRKSNQATRRKMKQIIGCVSYIRISPICFRTNTASTHSVSYRITVSRLHYYSILENYLTKQHA